MAIIYLARHGQDEDNARGLLNGRRDFPLTALGLSQAEALAAAIKEAKLEFDYIYSSPLERAYQTASVVSSALAVSPPEKWELLIERDFGIMTGKEVSQVETLCAPDILKTSTVTYFLYPLGAETFPELLERAKNVISEITSRHPEGNILLVTHGDLGKMLFASYYGISWPEVLSLFHFGNSELLMLAPGIKPEEARLFVTRQYNN